MKNTTTVLAVIAPILLVILLVIFAPLAVIWSLNTLFQLAIPYNFYTWLAVVVMNLTWMAKVPFSK